ncbi:uncharacterized protein LOC120146299 [Hibiscus syriacus]|uniref:uncharacterized protein LOC120146299 n=1 Tax=Hibiscus syriacus TaxID=106335 RepID=UPI001922F313|nr:uncharacterized protein LOC120146299 [Hibiscus syriacus]
MQDKSCSGFIIRDSAGFILGSGFIHNHHIASVFMEEALTILQVIHFAKDIGITRLTLESDSKKIIQKLIENTADLSEVGPILGDVKNAVGSLTSCSFGFTGRNGNREAHAMAVEGSRVTYDQFWIEDAPEKALQVADDDRRFIDPA